MTIMTLWLPILVSAVVVFIAGAVIWMVMPWHKTDWSKTADEEAVRAALKSTGPGMYSLPHCNPEQFKDPAMQQKFKDGPQAFITVVPNGMPQTRYDPSACDCVSASPEDQLTVMDAPSVWLPLSSLTKP